MREYITGIRDSKIARAYTFVALLRRTLFIVWLIGFYYVGNYTLCIGMAVIQVVYVVFIIIIRPFDRPENNLVEIANEMFYLGMILMLIWLDQREEWTKTRTKIFTGLVFGNSITITLIMTGI